MRQRRTMVVTRHPRWSLAAGIVLGVITAVVVVLFGPGGEKTLRDGVRLSG